MAAPLYTLPVTLVDCPVCHFAKAALAYQKVNRSYFFCPACKHVWSLPSKLPASEGLARSRQDEISARLRNIRSLCQVLERMSRTSARYRMLAGDLQAEAVAYLKLVDAERGVDRTRHRRSRRTTRTCAKIVNGLVRSRTEVCSFVYHVVSVPSRLSLESRPRAPRQWSQPPLGTRQVPFGRSRE